MRHPAMVAAPLFVIERIHGASARGSVREQT